MRKTSFPGIICPCALIGVIATASVGATVPTDVQMPGTQPREIGGFELPDRCQSCHGGFNPVSEPWHTWQGGMMSLATRDPIFWATVAIAEQDFPGSGDICLRCHTPSGWYGGRSEPTNGSALQDSDAGGVICDACHKMTNPNDQEHLGIQNPPFVANDGGVPPTGYYGSGMLSLWPDAEKLGPYQETAARHQFMQSVFHRSRDYCGSCHDISNPVVGDLAHNAGAQPTADPVVRSGDPGAPVEGKAAFNNFPYQYGVIERTFSEHMASAFPFTLVRDYDLLPEDLKDGAVQYAYEQAQIAGRGGDYEDGTERFFTCQSCHMAPVQGKGCKQNDAPLRGDLPLHDQTGGNYWGPEAVKYFDLNGLNPVGQPLTDLQLAAIDDGVVRARASLDRAARLEVDGNTLRVVNLTGHKLISGYPEGRRMWLNIKWYDRLGGLIREDGEYGQIEVVIEGQPTLVDTILELHDPNTVIYEAHYAMTKEWAVQLLDLGYPADFELSYDRVTGEADYTLGELAAQDPGTWHETFHFVLNNYVAFDNRIPPYGMQYEESRKRNVLPVPEDLYRDPNNPDLYQYWDEVQLDPPPAAVRATIDLLYQPTSWEYINFLHEANDEADPFLGTLGDDMLQAWLNTGMAAPHIMASAEWQGGGGRVTEPRGGGAKLEPISVWRP